MKFITPTHNLLPLHAQRILMDAASTERLDFIERAIATVRDVCPNKFYDDKDKALADRVFYDEPANSIPMKGFVSKRERRL
jgi:hypothetical protein